MEGERKKGKGRGRGGRSKKTKTKSEESENDDEIEMKKEKQEEDEQNETTFAHKNTKTTTQTKKNTLVEKSTKKKKDTEKIIIPELIEEETQYEFEFETEEGNSFIGFLNSVKLLLPGKYITLIFTKTGLYHVSKDIGDFIITETNLEKPRIDCRGEYQCQSIKDETCISLTCEIAVLLKKIDTKRAEKLRLCVETGKDTTLYVMNIRGAATVVKEVDLKSPEDDAEEEENENQINIPRYPKDLRPTIKVKGSDLIADLRKVKFTYVHLSIQNDAMIIKGYNQSKEEIERIGAKLAFTVAIIVGKFWKIEEAYKLSILFPDEKKLLKSFTDEEIDEYEIYLIRDVLKGEVFRVNIAMLVSDAVPWNAIESLITGTDLNRLYVEDVASELENEYSKLSPPRETPLCSPSRNMLLKNSQD